MPTKVVENRAATREKLFTFRLLFCSPKITLMGISAVAAGIVAQMDDCRTVYKSIMCGFRVKDSSAGSFGILCANKLHRDK